MALRIRFAYTSGAALGYSIERLADGLFYDFSTSTFVATPATLINTLPALAGNFTGLYSTTIAATPQAQFANGEYAVNIHNTGSANAIVGVIGATMYNGDSAPVFPSGAGVDPWSTALPGAYAAGTAGAILGTYLDARISSRSIYAGGAVASVTSPVTVGTVNDKAGYSLAASQTFSTTGSVGSLAAPVTVGTNNDKAGYSLGLAQTFSTSGSVGGVAGPVTVGTNNDKLGYVLAPSGLDPIAVEVGINVRQALSPILAAAAGGLSGAGTGTILIKGGNVATTRITATTDNAGNRSSVTLSLPT